MALTEEQKVRMEQNRALALERKRKRELVQASQSSQSSPTKANQFSNQSSSGNGQQQSYSQNLNSQQFPYSHQNNYSQHTQRSAQSVSFPQTSISNNRSSFPPSSSSSQTSPSSSSSFFPSPSYLSSPSHPTTAKKRNSSQYFPQQQQQQQQFIQCDQLYNNDDDEVKLVTPTEMSVNSNLPHHQNAALKMSKKNRNRFEVPTQRIDDNNDEPLHSLKNKTIKSSSSKPSAFDVMMKKNRSPYQQPNAMSNMKTNLSSSTTSSIDGDSVEVLGSSINKSGSYSAHGQTTTWPSSSNNNNNSNMNNSQQPKPAFHHYATKALTSSQQTTHGQSSSSSGPSGSSKSSSDQVTLSSEQQAVLKLALSGASIFFTGNAGTGKSTLLKVIIAALKKRLGASSLAVTASTGAAATLISGTTVHSFSGCGLAKESGKELAVKVSKNKNSKKRWIDTDCLVIDEISMLDADLFDKLNIVAKACKKSTKHFGGIQLILCGDFFQLPPVSKDKATKFCFEAECWKSVINHSIVLQTVFRQKNQEFVTCLNECRNATLSSKTCALLSGARQHRLNDPEPTKLCAFNNAADRTNQVRLNSLSGNITKFTAIDKGQEMYVQQLQKNSQAPTNLELKLGAKVILLKNLDLDWGLCNGSRGTVIGYHTPSPTEVANDEDDGGKGVTLIPNEALPVIEFRRADGNVTERSIGREDFSIELQGKTVATRSQLPLKLAWAISIHKSQGMTIDCLEVDLGGCFECGQAYVALSRATSFEQLRVLNFSPGLVKAHPKVREFYKTLNSV